MVARGGISMRPISLASLVGRISTRFTLVAAACVMVASLSQDARSHVHVLPDGTTVKWYPQECCHDRDCRPVAVVRAGPEGLWMTTVDGQTILIGRNDARRPSQDMRWHICLGPDEHSHTVVQCIFEPPSM